MDAKLRIINANVYLICNHTVQWIHCTQIRMTAKDHIDAEYYVLHDALYN